MGEGRQSPTETLKGYCQCLLSCVLGDPQIYANLPVITSTFLKKPQNCVPLTLQMLFSTDSSCSYAVHCSASHRQHLLLCCALFCLIFLWSAST